MTARPLPPDEPSERHDDAEAAVARRLRTLSDADYPSLPAAVADRLDETLAQLPELADVKLSESELAESAPPPKRSWLRTRFVVAASVALMLLGVAGGVLWASQLGHDDVPSASNEDDQEQAEPGTAESETDNAPQATDDDFDTDGDGEGDEPADDQPHGEEESELLEYALSYSGHDYDADEDLRTAASRYSGGSPDDVDDSLGRLVHDPQARDQCLSGAQAAHGGVVSVVDFGSFEGQPAMIAVIERADGSAVGAALGPQCGPHGTDELYSQEL